MLIGQWRRHYNTVRSHSVLGYRPPAPEVLLTALQTMPGHPRASRISPKQAHHALTFRPDHLVGAGQSGASVPLLDGGGRTMAVLNVSTNAIQASMQEVRHTSYLSC